MVRLYKLVAVLLLVSGCFRSPDSNATHVTQMTHSAYLGKRMILFILDNGSPYLKKHLKHGGYHYKWHSGDNSLIGLQSRQRWEGREDRFLESECEVDIYVSSKDRIVSIFAYTDWSKRWDVDACARYLK